MTLVVLWLLSFLVCGRQICHDPKMLRSSVFLMVHFCQQVPFSLKRMVKYAVH